MEYLSTELIKSQIEQDGYRLLHNTHDFYSLIEIDSRVRLVVKNKSKKSNAGIVVGSKFADLCSLLMQIEGVTLKGGYYRSSALPQLLESKTGFLFWFSATDSISAFLRTVVTYFRDGEQSAKQLVYENYLATQRQTTKQTTATIRIGQGGFRQEQLVFWSGMCAVTSLAAEPFLRASHIKPWRVCNSRERLDVNNGLLLIANLDIAFDIGLITFDENGNLIRADCLSAGTAEAIGIRKGQKLRKLSKFHLPYLEYHRTHIFQK